MDWQTILNAANDATALFAAASPAITEAEGTARMSWQDVFNGANGVATLLSGALTPIIAIIALYIAWRQHKTAQSTLKLNLYDRRFKVFRGLMDLLGAVLREVGVSKDDLAKYYAETNEKEFLFDDDIVEFMAQVRDKAVDLRQVTRRIQEMPDMSQDERDQHCERESELLQWFIKQGDAAAGRFNKYLDFKRNL